MAVDFGNSVNFNLFEILNATAQNLAVAPAHKPGRFYYDTAQGKIGISNGASWAYLGAQQETVTDTEAVQDIVGALFAGSTGVVSTYDDTSGVITLTVGTGQITNTQISASAAITLDKMAETTGLKIFTAAERTKLTGIATGATTNSSDATLLARANHTGTQSADTIVDGTSNKVYTAAEKTKLTAVASGATANSTDATLLARANHTGTQSADTITDGTTNKAFLATEKTKLAGIAAGATVNSADATLLARGNHTGTQTASTISDFQTAVDARVNTIVGAAPAALDTLVELAAALGNDANFAATMTAQLALKANISSLAAVATSGSYVDLLNKPAYATTIGDGTATVFTITHNLNTRDVVVVVAQAATPFNTILTQTANTTVNTVTITFGTAPTTNQYRVSVKA